MKNQGNYPPFRSTTLLGGEDCGNILGWDDDELYRLLHYRIRVLEAAVQQVEELASKGSKPSGL